MIDPLSLIKRIVHESFTAQDGESCKYCGEKLSADYKLTHREDCLLVLARQIVHGNTRTTTAK